MAIDYPAEVAAIQAPILAINGSEDTTVVPETALGDDFSTGPSEYYLEGKHISNGVNKYITEELSGELLLTDHRTAEKTTEETLIELLATGRPAVIEVCYLPR